MDINAILDAVEAERPEAPFIGDDEWDLNDAYRDGWLAALDAVAAKVKSDLLSDDERSAAQ